FSLSEVFFFPEEGGGPWDWTQNTSQLGPGASPSGDSEAGVLPGAFPRQDITPVILISRVPLRLEPHSESGEDRWRSSGLLAVSWRWRFPKKRSEYLSMMHKGMSGCFEGYYGRLFFWRCVSSGFLCWRSSSEAYNGSSLVISMGDFPGNVVRLSVSAIYDEHQKAKTWKRRPFYTPPPRLARATSLVNGLSSTSSTGVEVVLNHDPLGDAHRRLIGEVFFLRSQVQNMMACRDLLIQQVKASTRWELMKEWLEKREEHWDLEEEYHRHLLLSGGIDQQSGSFSRVATPRSVVGSRFSEEPSF
ncbi:hypothetical protein HID58_042746, partial [Brassica napus]